LLSWFGTRSKSRAGSYLRSVLPRHRVYVATDSAPAQLRLHTLLQRLGQLAQIFVLLLGRIQRQRAVGVFRGAADEVEGVAVPVVEFITALMNFFPPALGRTVCPLLGSSPRRARSGICGRAFLNSAHRCGRINLLTAIWTCEVFERSNRIVFAPKSAAPVFFDSTNCRTTAGWTGGDGKLFFSSAHLHSALLADTRK